MATRSPTAWKFLLPAFSLAVVLAVPAFGQGEESEGSSGSSAVSRAGNMFHRIFSGRSSEASSEASSEKPAPRGFKPGIFQGGIVKQLKAIADPSDDSEVTVEKNSSNKASSTQRQAPSAMSPSQMAQRVAPREPFTSPPPSNNPSTKKPAATSSRDIFSEDPPSLVGSGVSPRAPAMQQQSSTTGQLRSFEPPINRDSSRADDMGGVPKDSAPQSDMASISSRSRSTESTGDQVFPHVSRKTVPTSSTTTTSTTSTQTNSGSFTNPAKSTSASSNQSRGSDSPQAPYSTTSNPYTSQSRSGYVPESNRYVPNSNTANAPSVNRSSATGSASPANSSNSGSSTNATASFKAAGETRAEMGVPKVKLFVSGPPSLQIGRALPYEVLVRNEGNELLTGVIVSMAVPASVKTSLPVASAGEFESEKDDKGAETLLWHVTDLAPAQTRVFRVSLEATKPEHFSFDVEWTVLPQTGSVQIAVQQPQLTLGLEGPSQVLWGKSEVYRLRVRNPGNADVKDVQVRLTAESYGSNQSKIGDVAAGGEKVVEVELTFQQAGLIKLSGAAESAAQALQADAAIDVAVEQVNLAMEWRSPAEQYIGSVADHLVVVTNSSRLAADNAVCSVMIPSGFKVVSMPVGANVRGSEITWTVPRLEPNSPQAFDFALQALETGDTKLMSNVTSSGGGKATSELAVKVDAVTDLKLTVTDPVAPAPVGQDVIYDLTIVNRGSKAATAVQVLAQFSNGIEPIRAEGGSGKVLPGQVVFDTIPTIAAGAQVTLRVVAQASEPGMHRFRAELQCEEGETQLVEEESTRYLATTKSDPNRSTIRR
jgi:hypothetical protein